MQLCPSLTDKDLCQAVSALNAIQSAGSQPKPWPLATGHRIPFYSLLPNYHKRLVDFYAKGEKVYCFSLCSLLMSKLNVFPSYSIKLLSLGQGSSMAWIQEVAELRRGKNCIFIFTNPLLK